MALILHQVVSFFNVAMFVSIKFINKKIEVNELKGIYNTNAVLYSSTECFDAIEVFCVCPWFLGNIDLIFFHC